MRLTGLFRFIGLIPLSALFAQEQIPNIGNSRNHGTEVNNVFENVATGLPALPPIVAGQVVFPIIQDPELTASGATVYYQATAKGAVRIEVPKGQGLGIGIPGAAVGGNDSVLGFKPSAANEIAVAQAQLNIAEALKEKGSIATKAAAIETAKTSKSVSYPVQKPDQPVSGQPVSPMLLKVGALLDTSSQDEVPPAGPKLQEQNAKADAYYDQARASLGLGAESKESYASHGLVKSAAPDLAPYLKSLLGGLVKLDAKGAAPVDYRASLNSLLENNKFQSYAATELGVENLNTFNQAVVAGNRVLTKPDSGEWQAIDAAFSLATGETAPGEKAESASAGDVASTGTLASTGAGANAPLESSNLAGGGDTGSGTKIPASALEWIQIARFLASPEVLARMKDGEEKRRRFDGLLALEAWLVELRNFQGLDQLTKLQIPARYDPQAAGQSVERIRKVLRSMRGMEERGLRPMRLKIRMLKAEAQKTLDRLDSVNDMSKTLEILKTMILPKKIQVEWLSVDSVLYQQFRRGVAELTFEILHRELSLQSSNRSRLIEQALLKQKDQRVRASLKAKDASSRARPRQSSTPNP